MDVIEEGLEGFVQHVCEVILELLGSLDGKEKVHAFGQAAQVFLDISVVSIAKFI